MQQFTVHTGQAAPLRRSNVDTDQIIPAVYLKRVTKTGFADGLFASWRTDPDFVLNRPEYAGASVLVAGTEFGTGSSREHAVWALRDWGFRAVIAPRFGDIFRGNAFKAGLLPVELPEDTVAELWDTIEAQPSTSIVVDVVERRIRVLEREWSFSLDDHNRYRLIEGLDDIDLALRNEFHITAFESKRPQWLPTTLPIPSGRA